MAINPNTNFVAGAILTADQQNRFPRGIVAYTESTSSDTFTTAEKLMITSSSFTAVAGRNYLITYYEPKQLSSAATSESEARIRLTNISGAVQQTGYIGTGSVVQNSQIVQVVTTFTAGATTVCATQQAATGTTTLGRSATVKAFIMVEDLGPA